jgi:RNA polymerase sigma-70 factor (ECF subfamily)
MRTRPLHFLVNKSSNKYKWHKTNTAWTSHYASGQEDCVSVLSRGQNDLPLNELLQLCLQSRQDTTWGEFVRCSHPVIAGVVIKTMRRWIRPTPNLVDDLVQETYLKLCRNDFRALREFVLHHENALFGFLKVVASNVVQDHFRGIYSRKRGSGLVEAELGCAYTSPVHTNPSATMEHEILLQNIDWYLKSYAGPNSSRDRMIFWLHYRNGLTAKAISGLPSIKLSVKGVESIILRLVRLVRLKVNTPPENR